MNYFPSEVTIGLLEIPDEISLIIPLAGCGHECVDCHSPQYQSYSKGEELTYDKFWSLINKYTNKVSCVCFFGGEHNLESLKKLSEKLTYMGFKTALYSGYTFDTLPFCLQKTFDYLKLGQYSKKLGGLDSKTTNQRLYKLEDSGYIDITYKFWSNND